MLTVTEVCSASALAALRPEWDALHARCPDATPFQTADWLLPWWRHIGEGDLWTLALRDADGTLVGLAPLYVWTRPDDGARHVFSVGIGTTDYLDPLFAPGHEDACAAAVFAHLSAHRDRWDVAEWQQLRADSPLLSAPCPPDLTDDGAGPQDACPLLPLSASERGPGGEVIPRKLRENLVYYARRAERLGPVRYERAETPERAACLFDHLLRLHAARWAMKGEGGVLSDPCVQRAHRESLPGLLARDALRLYALHVGESVAAVLYAFADARRAYYYLGGWDPAFEAVSPGTLLIGHAVREAAREGKHAFDFLRGQEPYKYRWGATDVWTQRRTLRSI